MIAADTGEVRVDDCPMTGVNTRASIVFQNYSLLPWFSAIENVGLAVKPRSRNGREQSSGPRPSVI